MEWLICHQCVACFFWGEVFHLPHAVLLWYLTVLWYSLSFKTPVGTQNLSLKAFSVEITDSSLTFWWFLNGVKILWIHYDLPSRSSRSRGSSSIKRLPEKVGHQVVKLSLYSAYWAQNDLFFNPKFNQIPEKIWEEHSKKETKLWQFYEAAWITCVARTC